MRALFRSLHKHSAASMFARPILFIDIVFYLSATGSKYGRVR